MPTYATYLSHVYFFPLICSAFMRNKLGSETSAATECQWAGRDVIAIDRSASSKSCCLDGRNWQFLGDKILDLESDFPKLGSVTMLRSLTLIASLVQIDT